MADSISLCTRNEVYAHWNLDNLYLALKSQPLLEKALTLQKLHLPL